MGVVTHPPEIKKNNRKKIVSKKEGKKIRKKIQITIF